MAAKDLLRNHWPPVAITVTAAAFGCVGLVVLWTMPPRSIVMATGLEAGTYYELGEQYRTALGNAGVEVRLMPTAGSVENLALLRDPKFRGKCRSDAGRRHQHGNRTRVRIAGDSLLRTLFVVSPE